MTEFMGEYLFVISISFCLFGLCMLMLIQAHLWLASARRGAAKPDARRSAAWAGALVFVGLAYAATAASAWVTISRVVALCRLALDAGVVPVLAIAAFITLLALAVALITKKAMEMSGYER